MAHNQKAANRWRQAMERKRPVRPKSDAEIEAAILNVARLFPANVTRATV